MARSVYLLIIISGIQAVSADDRYEIQAVDVHGQPIIAGPASKAEPSSGGEVQATVVCFIGTECPLVRLYASRLSELAAEYQKRGVRLIGVDSNRQDSPEEVKKFADDFGLSFPVIHDMGNAIADRYGAKRTPEIFLLDRDFRLRYTGRIDDQYSPGINRAEATRQDLREAIEDVLAGRSVAVTQTEAVGCLIGRRIKRDVATVTPESDPLATITYSSHVAGVLDRHCVECHRDGEIGPFSLERWEDVEGWAATMVEVVDQGRMPPWHADDAHAELANARTMPEADKEILRKWLADGCPQGDESFRPSIPALQDGWQLESAPDLVVEMRAKPYRVPAEGTVEYQYFVTDPGFTEDRWVKAAQIIPGNRSVVHHAIAFIRPPDGGEFRGVGWLTAYVPGQRIIPLPAGHARKVPAGSKIVFQMHYTTNGREQEDITKIGLIFAKPEEVTDEVITLIGIDQDFEIPPHAANHTVAGEVSWKPASGRLLSFAPHMHVRGKSFELDVIQNGSNTTILNVPRYDFNWQHSYVLKNPIPLEEIEKISFRATFDNSPENPFNPDPAQWVNWGDQTWEEMAVVFLEVSEPVSEKTKSRPKQDSQSAEVEKKVDDYVADFFRELDKNGDDVVLRSEAPIAVRTHFRRYDQNGDGLVDRAEVTAVARRRFGR